MKARLRFYSKISVVHNSGLKVALAELKVWDVGISVHYPLGIKYGMFLVQPSNGLIIVGMDNHKPKVPHLHMNGNEMAYAFLSIERLIDDFWRLAAQEGYDV